ncbi:hypothetical protein PHLGIDRAFT_109905 [Phlebiopsis gigantea 11061_1 CR5-6]|uniref:NADH-ubiquinone oxidoreductase 9.5 kDa subunit n=1 Tax=Phlebiopsis gigantea (strain 11061_1 CR5-6) TaxID=745531 RepID=A0A0C3NH91_PHLG1|nr:hypothetical protein PHLGIDRAFT_109905 [Phlebiopsis gigantea 11061_1 CR5-6]
MVLSAFRHGYRYLQRQAHEQPVIFYSCVLGLIGPVMVITVPPIRETLGYKPIERPPTTYPLPNRPRVAVTGYED